MTPLPYSLDKPSYSWRNAFLWGNFGGHCKKANEGNLGTRAVHVLIAAVEFLPIIGQISSICEKLIMDYFSNRASSSKTPPLRDKRISVETTKKKNITDDVKGVLTSSTISPVREVSPGVYTADGKTEKEENIYFGMEQLNDASREIWSDYSTYARVVSRQMLPAVMSLLDDEEKPTEEERKDLQEASGLSEEEFENLLTQCEKRALHRQGSREKAIDDIPGGIAGFIIWALLDDERFAPATHVAYIAKKPITGRLSLPKTELNLKIFKEKYKDIVMSVGVRLDNSRPLFENRGIFRNPFSVVEGGYSNISTQLHSFTGKVMKECVNKTLGHQEKIYMSVSPTNNMKELLMKKIGLERIKMKNEIPEELRLKSSGIGEQQFLIRLEDLASLH